jgi:surface antigen
MLLKDRDKEKSSTALQESGKAVPQELAGKSGGGSDQLPFPEAGQMPFSNVSTPFSGSSLSAGSNNGSSSAITPVQDAVSSQSTSQIIIPLVRPTAEESKGPARPALVIPTTGKKSAGTLRAPARGKRIVLHAGVTLALIVVLVGVFSAFLPVDTHGQTGSFGIFRPLLNMTTSKQAHTALIQSQAATATAVTQDGYEYNGAGGGYTFADVNTNIAPQQVPTPTTTNPTNTENSGDSTIGTGSSTSSTSSGTISDADFNDPFTPGQCTYWADYRYHQLTGYAVTWTGNADVWASMAAGTPGWIVSSTPHVPSIIVLQPGTQYAGPYGHVGVVESINSDGSVYTSDWNIVGWGVLSYQTYQSGAGVQYIWHS